MNQVHPNTVRQFLFIGILLFLFILLFGQVYFMISAFLGACTLYVLMRRMMQRLTSGKRPWPRALAAIFLMLISVVVIVLPFAWIVMVLANKVSPYINNPHLLETYVNQIRQYMIAEWDINLSGMINTSAVFSSLSKYLPKLAGSTLMTVSNLSILYFVLYFMLVKYDVMERKLREFIPLKYSNKDTLLHELNRLVMSNAVSIPALALVQGVIASIGYWIFDVQEPLLWGIITGICSVIPIVGTMIAWGPVVLYLFASGQEGNAVGLLLWGLLVIGSADNVFRFLLQKRLADVHPMITVFGVIIGVNLFGFWGIIFGPLLISLFLLLLNIYKDEFGAARDASQNSNPPKDIV